MLSLVVRGCGEFRQFLDEHGQLNWRRRSVGMAERQREVAKQKQLASDLTPIARLMGSADSRFRSYLRPLRIRVRCSLRLRRLVHFGNRADNSVTRDAKALTCPCKLST